MWLENPVPAGRELSLAAKVKLLATKGNGLIVTGDVTLLVLAGSSCKPGGWLHTSETSFSD